MTQTSAKSEKEQGAGGETQESLEVHEQWAKRSKMGNRDKKRVGAV